MMEANQREPFFHRMKKPVTHMEKPVINTEANKLLRTQPPYEYTFTAKPVNAPVNIDPVTTQPRIEKTYMYIPSYVLKSLELNDNRVKENAINIKDLFSNVRPNQIKKITLPIVDENLVNQLIKQEMVDEDNTQNFRPQLPVLTEKPVNELTDLTDKYNTQFSPQLPALSEKPVYEQYVKSKNKGRLGLYVPYLPTLPKIPVNAPVNVHKESLLKEKLVSLFLSSRKDAENQIRNTQSIHNTFKSGTMYKIGYLTSLIDKTNDGIKRLYKTVQGNLHNWDSLRILEAYEQMKRYKEKIQELLDMMQSFLRIQGKPGNEALKGGGHNKGISWSYYDDSLV